ncbi:MAG: DUF1080 domain-containing protein [Phycisphaerae bacterium]|nr:DUF1080 domain-containing protein [Phycisphaerae bacterium]
MQLPAILSSGMVLQQQTNARLWGWANPNESIRVTPSWPDAKPIDGKADGRGRWEITLPTPTPGGPYSINIVGENQLTISDVLVGEVWVCSGQSNMEWPLSAIPAVPGDKPATEEIAAADYPRIRLFTVENTISLHPRADTVGAWKACAPRSAAEFSAVGYFFGRELHDKLNVPIGLVSADWGGTPAEAWTPEGMFDAFPEYAGAMNTIRTLRDPDTRSSLQQDGSARWWDNLDNVTKAPAGWTGADFDDSKWSAFTLPATLAGNGLDARDGLFYFRLVVDLPADAAGKEATLALGPIDDRDTTWVNGTQVGATHSDGQWNVAREYDLPKGVLKAGKNVVAVRVLDTAGPGGINGKPEQMFIDIGGKKTSLAGAWRLLPGAQAKELPPIQQPQSVNAGWPTSLYNGMIAPLTPMAIRGAIWYQGESNVGRAEQYSRLFPAMIQGWRRAWGRGDFPFLFVQIAPFSYGPNGVPCAELREAQTKSLATPNTGMAVTMDIGDPRDIHPGHKDMVGKRLAAWALAKTYGKDVAYSGPMFKSASFEGGVAKISFDHAEKGLKASTGVTHLQVAGDDRVFHPAVGKIEGSTLVVSSDAVKAPAAVRYAWDDDCAPNLFNADGFPAVPFRTDTWGADGAKAAAAAAPVALFNGKDFAGWKFEAAHEGHWKVLDGGVIDYDGKATDLWTNASFRDFELTLDWRWSGPPHDADLPIILPTGENKLGADGKPATQRVKECGDSGVYLRGSSKSQVNIWCWPIGSGEVYGYRTDGSMPPEVKAGVTPKVNADKPLGEWNTFVITMKGELLTVVLNGQKVLDNARLPGVAPEGPIALQHHGDMIQFRNIKIRELK